MNRASLVVAAVLLATINSVFSQTTSEITEDIIPEVKKVGETAYLNCSVNHASGTESKVKWTQIRQSSGVLITRDDSVVLDINPVYEGKKKYDVKVSRKPGSSNTKIYQLIIGSLVEEDSGKYQCDVQIPGTYDSPTKQGTLTVLVPPIIQPQSTVTADVKEKASLNLTCIAEGYPTPNITWIRANGEAMPAGYIVEGKHIGNTAYSNISLPSVTTVDRGVYRCVADNSVRPPATHDATVRVEFSPSARAIQPSVGAPRGTQFTATLECILSGTPDPEVRWYYVGKKSAERKAWKLLSAGAKYSLAQGKGRPDLKVGDTYHSMTIRALGANDYGNYTCQGKNKYGITKAFLLLFETNDPGYVIDIGIPDPGQIGSHGSACKSSLLISFFVSFIILFYHHVRE